MSIPPIDQSSSSTPPEGRPAADLPNFDALPTVHNCIAVYTDGTDAIAEYSRPQDWGDHRWMYRAYRISAPNVKHTCIFHCWIEQALKEYEHLQTFAQFFGAIMLPGEKPELCDRNYLAEEDFWDESWGAMPPFYDEQDSDDDE